MNIYAKRGTKVVFTNEGGYDHEKEEAVKYLTVGEVYTVRSTDVSGWHTDVHLEEVADRSFNSVQFEDLVNPIEDLGDEWSESGDARCNHCETTFHYNLDRGQNFYRDVKGVYRLECPNCLARNR